MQIILLHDVDKVGRRGAQVNVANGYARNYLFPQGLAVRADTSKKKELEMRLASLEARDDRDRKEAAQRATTINGVSIEFSAAAGDENRLYGSVTVQNIVAALAEKGHEIDAKQIVLDEPLKTLGEFAIPVKLHRDVVAEIQLRIVRA